MISNRTKWAERILSVTLRLLHERAASSHPQMFDATTIFEFPGEDSFGERLLVEFTAHEFRPCKLFLPNQITRPVRPIFWSNFSLQNESLSQQMLITLNSEIFDIFILY